MGVTVEGKRGEASFSRSLRTGLIVLSTIGTLLFATFQLGRISEMKGLARTFKYYIHTTNDFGGLSRYQPDNAKLPPPEPKEKRVVLFGDSITDYWPLDRYFPGKPYINRGIAGQTTEQMLVRFKQDVLDLHPAVVVILAGGNDIMGHTGPEEVSQIEADIQMMAEMSHFHGIRAVIASVLPVSKTLWGVEDKAKIVTLNVWLKNYAAQNDYPYVDYYDALQDGKDNLVDKFHRGDGMHPSPAGYAVMALLAEKAIEQAEANTIATPIEALPRSR
jgi:lysophospholipase L1-like esterase